MEENEEKVTEEVTQESVEETTQVEGPVFDSADDDSVVKVDLSKPVVPVENEAEESTVEEIGEIAETEETTVAQSQEEEVQQEVEAQEEVVVEETLVEEPQVELPENIQKLMDFMDETGGDMNDYVRLNSDNSNLSDMEQLRDYYLATKPHLDAEDVSLLLEDFAYDEDIDDDRDIRKTKIAIKEELSKAKTHMDGLKSKYYAEIKGSSKLTAEQSEAVKFYDEYQTTSKSSAEQTKLQSEKFQNETSKVFNSEFKGFEYKAGDKSYRVEVKDAQKVKANQADLGNFIGTFLDKNNVIKDAAGYHKAIYAAMNADTLATHFYEQGKADAIKTSQAKAKNIDMSGRKQHGGVTASGVTVRALSGNDDGRLRIKRQK